MKGAAGLASGSIFAGDYRIVRPLSAGGMGAVYVALQLSTERERALKIMLGDLLGQEDLKRRFAQEAKIGAQIESEHVVEVVGAGVDQDSGLPWLAMELLQGRDLSSYLAARGPLPLAVVLELFEQLAHAVGAAHDKQIVHRDLKPENLFLAQTRRTGARFILKVLDFGIAKLLGQAKTSATGAMGTPLWMAPEQTQAGARITPAADVWAMGLIAFRALAGKSFWKSASDPNASAVMVLREVAIEAIPTASARATELGCPPLPAGFDGWFARCVDRDAARRFPDANVMFEALKKLLEAGLQDAPRSSSPSSSFDVGRPSAPSTPMRASQPEPAEEATERPSSREAPPGTIEAAPLTAARQPPPRAETPVEPVVEIPKRKLPIGLLAAAGLVIAATSVFAWTRSNSPPDAPSARDSATTSQASVVRSETAPAQTYDDLVKDAQRLAKQGKLDDALKVLARAKQMDANRPDAYYLGGFVHLKQCFKGPRGFNLPCDDCDTSKCQSCVRDVTAAADRGGFKRNVFNGAHCRAGLGNSMEALRDFDTALAEDPKDPQILVDRAVLLLSMGRRHDACTDVAAAEHLGTADVDRALSEACASELAAASASGSSTPPPAPAAGGDSTGPGSAKKGNSSVGGAAVNGNVPNAGSVVAGMAPGFRRCCNKGVEADPNLKGTTRITLKIGPNGEVQSANPSGSLPGSVQSCMAGVASGRTFSPPEGGGATIVVPVTCQAQQ